MSKIESDKINFGSSFVVSTKSSRLSDDEIVQAAKIAQNIVVEAKNKALIIESQASSNAEKITAQAREDASSLIAEVTESARQDGFKTGYKEGFEKITAEMEDKMVNLDNFAKSEFEIKKRIIKSAHADILELVIAIAKKVCHCELAQNPELIEKLTLAAISQLQEKESVNIIVNPQMAQKIYSASDRLKEAVEMLENIKIVEDNSISADGTIVESAGSRVDSRLCAQIDKIAQELYNELNSTPEDDLVTEAQSMHEKAPE